MQEDSVGTSAVHSRHVTYEVHVDVAMKGSRSEAIDVPIQKTR